MPELHELLATRADLIQLVEVEPQNLWRRDETQAGGYRYDPGIVQHLQALPQNKLVHGVGFPVGGSIAPDAGHLPLLQETIETLGASLASEHLTFNHASGPHGIFHTGFLLPPLQTDAGVAAAAASIRLVADQLPVPFAVETGVNYLRPRAGELSDGAFTAAVAEVADCGILLDLHNLYANECNGRPSVEAFLAEIPLDRVREVHVAGGLRYQGYWLDAHSGAVPDAVLELARRFVPQLPNLRALIFEILPSFIPELSLEGVIAQIEALAAIRDRCRSVAPPVADRPELIDLRTRGSESGFSTGSTRDTITPADWENALGALVAHQSCTGPLARQLADDPGVHVLQGLTNDARAGRIATALPLTVRLLLLECGLSAVDVLLSDYFPSTPPSLFASDEARHFVRFLESRDLRVRYLADVLAIKHATLDTLLTSRAHTAHCTIDPLPLCEALRSGRVPPDLPDGSFALHITPEEIS